MLTLINTNRIRPAIAPIALDYLAGAARAAGIEVELLDLCLADDPHAALRGYFARRSPRLVGVTFRNVDDSFWPSAQSFIPALRDLVEQLRKLTDAPVALGGVGFSIFAERILKHTGADYGVRGDGEAALPALYRAVSGQARLEDVPGLVACARGARVANPPAWATQDGFVHTATARDLVDNANYFRIGGQLGLETKRGCSACCDFCADTLAKGIAARLRPPEEAADEAQALLRQGVDVLHLCDSEFNVPAGHARAVCECFVRRRLGERLRWYAYLAIKPFDAELAGAMRRAGCVGINFTAPAATEAMLRAYGQRHGLEDIAEAVRAARSAGITVMLDVMLGGPGETPQSVCDGVSFVKSIEPDCAGLALGVRLYPGLPLTQRIAAARPLVQNPGVRRPYAGAPDLLWPTYYVSPELGKSPAAVVREAVGGDRRFFEPSDEPGPSAGDTSKGYNYSDNDPLVRAIAAGARGAYWDILRGK